MVQHKKKNAHLRQSALGKRGYFVLHGHLASLLPPYLEKQSDGFSVVNIAKNPVIWPLALIIQVFLYSSFGILVNLSRVDGKVLYESSSVVFSIEVFKLVISLTSAWREASTGILPKFTMRRVLPFSVPAICYCLTNNLAVYMQNQMDPASFSVLCNMKIATTAILYRIIIKRKLSTHQWISLVLLIFAGLLNSYDGLSLEAKSLQEVHVTSYGLLMALLYSTASGFSGVYTEYILKRDQKVPLAFQNCYLYSFGVVLNLITWMLQKSPSTSQSFFHGFSGFTWAIVLVQSVNGLMMSLIMKHSNNIVRLFVISSSVPVATVLSMLIFHLHPGITFFFVVITVVFAICLYNKK